MENIKAKELFQEQFKFKLNESVRHKADFKNRLSSDLGLLIIQRNLEEEADDDGNVNFIRAYVCRMIRHSGSGDLARFKESELMTIAEYNKKAVENEADIEDMKNDMYMAKKEIFASFGVQRNTSVYLKNGDIIDKSVVYKVSGYSSSKEGTLLSLRVELGEGSTGNEYKVKSKDEFVLVSVADADTKEK